MTTAVLPAEYKWLAARTAALQDFPEFLLYVRIARAIPDGERFVIDPDGGAIRFELWPHLLRRARAWQSRKHNEIILKARQLGLSWLAAAYAAWTAIRQSSSKVLLLSQTEDDAEELMRKVQFVLEHLAWPDWLLPRYAKQNTEQVQLIGGGMILCVPSTERGGRGFTATLVIADEAAFHAHAAKNFSAYSPAALDGGQIIILSTGNGTTGFFHDLYVMARDGAAEFTPVFIDVFSRPDRDQDWYERARRTFPGIPQDFPQEYPRTEAEAFVSLTGLVFPQYTDGRHAIDYDPVPWSECLWRLIVSDYGGGDPTVLCALGVYRDQWGVKRVHQYGEFVQRAGAPTIGDLHQWCLGWFGWDPGEQTYLTTGHYIGDPIGQQTTNASLSVLMPGMVVVPKVTSRYAGLSTFAWFLDQEGFDGQPLFTLNKKACPHSHREFGEYRWQTTTDVNDKSRYQTSTPHDHHGDGIDAKRYGLNVIYETEFNRSETGVAYKEVIW